jgi:uncharacterized protein (TIGR02391 family)
MNETLLTFYPNVADFLAADPADIAPIMLRFGKNQIQNGMFIPGSVNNFALGHEPIAPAKPTYPMNYRDQINRHLAETWAWLEHHQYIVPAADLNGRNGWKLLTRLGEQAANQQDFARLRELTDFPKSMIHPSIADKVWKEFVANDLDQAVFAAFKAVEIAVRTAGGFKPTDIGVPLMRLAFKPNVGPLADQSKPESEQDALMQLFAGAIGSYKNPHSHRTVNLTDPREAKEQIILATHLLGIVDARTPKQ